MPKKYLEGVKKKGAHVSVPADDMKDMPKKADPKPAPPPKRKS